MDSQQRPEVPKPLIFKCKSAQMASQQLLEIVVKQCMDSQQPQLATGRHRGEISEPATFSISPKHHQFIDSSIHRMLEGSAAEAEPVN